MYGVLYITYVSFNMESNIVSEHVRGKRTFGDDLVDFALCYIYNESASILIVF